MGYLGYFYVEAKSFKILYKIRNKGIRLAERSKWVHRAVILGKSSVGWLLKMVELIRGDNQRDFCKTFIVDSIVQVA